MEKVLTVKVAGCGVENYLDDCLGTFADEKYNDKVEVIVVVNYCTDRSLEIARDYENRYPRIFKVVAQGKKNYASTYNVGFEMATGKYFTNLDGDDYFDKHVFDEYLECLVESNSDLIASDFLMFIENGKQKSVAYNKMENNKEYNFDEICAEIPFVQMHSMTIKTSIIKENMIMVNPNSIAADAEYTLLVSPYVNTVTFFRKNLYCYRQGRIGQDTGLDKLILKEKAFYDDSKRLIEWLNSLKNLPKSKEMYITKRIANMVDIEFYILLLKDTSFKILNKIINYKKEICKMNKDVYNNTFIAIRVMGIVPMSYPVIAYIYRIYKKNKTFIG